MIGKVAHSKGGLRVCWVELGPRDAPKVTMPLSSFALNVLAERECLIMSSLRRCFKPTTPHSFPEGHRINLDCQRSLLQLCYKHRLQTEQGSSAAPGRRCLVHRRGQDGGEEFGAVGVGEVRAAEWVRAARRRACPSSVRRQAKRLPQDDMR
jgi:hypothetical protein